MRIHITEQELTISIHAPHARSDELGEMQAATRAEFQSTLLMRGATLSSG